MEIGGDWTCQKHAPERCRHERGASPRGTSPPSWLAGGPENFEILDGRRCNLGIYLRKMKLLIGLKNAGFLGWIFVPLKEKMKKSKLQSKCHKIRYRLTMSWQTLDTPVDVRITSLHRGFFIHYRKSVTSNTFQFRDDSESKSVINKTLCGHRLHWFKKTVQKDRERSIVFQCGMKL